MNHLFERCARSSSTPSPSVVIGVSPRSYGFFHSNRHEAAGGDFLQAGRADVSGPRGGELVPRHQHQRRLAAGDARSSRASSADRAAPRPDYGRYRRLQIVYVYEGHHLRESIHESELDELRRLIARRERILYGIAFSLLRTLARIAPSKLRAAIPGALLLAERQFPAWYLWFATKPPTRASTTWSREWT